MTGNDSPTRRACRTASHAAGAAHASAHRAFGWLPRCRRAASRPPAAIPRARVRAPRVREASRTGRARESTALRWLREPGLSRLDDVEIAFPALVLELQRLDRNR